MTGVVTTQESKDAKLDIKILRTQLSNKQKHLITEDTVSELKKLSEDPDYGEEFLDTYRDHLNILGTNPKFTSKAYMSAVKFFSLVESRHSITDAYITVFPERMKSRERRGQDKSNITGEASRYNSTAIVNEIRKVAAIPVHLIHRNLLHEAILGQAALMREAKSEVVRQKAGEVLIRELKPSEESVINVQVDDGAKSAIASLQEATEKLVAREQQSINAGIPIKEVIEAKIIHKEIEVDELDLDDEGTPVEDTAEDVPLADSEEHEAWTY